MYFNASARHRPTAFFFGVLQASTRLDLRHIDLFLDGMKNSHLTNHFTKNYEENFHDFQQKIVTNTKLITFEKSLYNNIRY
jgi:hypothetical protein